MMRWCDAHAHAHAHAHVHVARSGADTPLQIKVSMQLTRPDLTSKQELFVFYSIRLQ